MSSLPPRVNDLLAGHPSATEDLGWIVEGLVMDAETLLSLNRRFLSPGARRLHVVRNPRQPTQRQAVEAWFVAVYGRASVEGELAELTSRDIRDPGLTGFQLFSLLVGDIRPGTTTVFDQWPRRMRLSHLLPVLVEYCGYRSAFYPEAQRYLHGVNRTEEFSAVPPWDRVREAGLGDHFPALQWENRIWILFLRDAYEEQYGHWRGYRGLWRDFFQGRPRPAGNPRPIPINQLQPQAAIGPPPPGANQNDPREPGPPMIAIPRTPPEILHRFAPPALPTVFASPHPSTGSPRVVLMNGMTPAPGASVAHRAGAGVQVSAGERLIGFSHRVSRLQARAAPRRDPRTPRPVLALTNGESVGSAPATTGMQARVTVSVDVEVPPVADSEASSDQGDGLLP